MANDRDDPTVHWIDPIRRGMIPLNRFHVPRRLRKTIRQRRFEIRIDHDFEEVIRSCADPTFERPRTWLNEELIDVYVELASRGHAHSVEIWQEDELVGGLYGLSLGGAFFGESMFSRARDASKIALVELVARLQMGGFTLLDTQFITSHLQQFGAIEISRQAYRKRLQRAISIRGRFPKQSYSFAVAAAGSSSPNKAAPPQSTTQTS